MKKISRFSFLIVNILVVVIIYVFVTSGFKAPEPNEYMNDTIVQNSEDTSVIDVTEQYIKLNSNEKYKPVTNFRSGHVTKAEIKDYLKKTDYGYVVNLGKHTNVPTPAVKSGVVYVSGGFGSKQYYAFEAKSGEKVWAVNLDDDGPSSPAIEDSIIVFNTESCTIFACNIKTGEQIWSYWLGDPLMSMPTIANGIVFSSYPAGSIGGGLQQQINMNNSFKSSNGNINIKDTTITIRPTHVFIALDLKTGKILWQNRIDGDVMSAPVAKGNDVYVTSFPGTVFKFNQKTGKILSAKAMRATSAPVINGDDMFISKRSDARGEAVSEVVVAFGVTKNRKQRTFTKKDAPYLDNTVQTKSELKTTASEQDAGNGFAGGAPSSSGWSAASMNIGQSNVSSLQSYQGSRTLHVNGKNYNTMGDELICTDTKSGKVVWKQKISGDMKKYGGFMGTPPLAVSNYIIIATYNGEVFISDSKTGKQIKKFDIKEPIRYQPVVADGWIYVTSTQGKLHAINTKNKKITGWSHWGANAARTNKIE